MSLSLPPVIVRSPDLAPTDHFVCKRNEAARFEGVEPTTHRPDAPLRVKRLCVSKNVVEMFDWRIGHRMMLMEGPGSRHQKQRQT